MNEMSQGRLEAAINVAAALAAVKCSQEPGFAREFLERPENWSNSDFGTGHLVIHPREESKEEARRCGKLAAAMAWMDSNHIYYPIMK